MENRVRYAVIGAGNIAQVAMLPAFAHAEENSELVALISGDPTKRSQLSEKYRIGHTGDYSSLESVLQSAKADAVYIATPNSTHLEYARRAAALGVHVLCEKPLAPNVADCEQIIEACAAAGVALMVAYRLHFERGSLSALDVVDRGELGEVRHFDSVFGHRVREDDIRMRPELGGGACLDLGVYCINAVRHLFRAEPLSVLARVSSRHGVDDTTSVLLCFDGDRSAHFTVSNSFASTSSYRVTGTKADLRVEPAFDYAHGLEHFLTIDKDVQHTKFDKGDHFAPQLLYFSKCLLEGMNPGPSGAEGIADVRVVEAVLQSASLGRSVELPPRPYSYRPARDNEVKKPAVPKPAPVNAPSPSA